LSPNYVEAIQQWRGVRQHSRDEGKEEADGRLQKVSSVVPGGKSTNDEKVEYSLQGSLAKDM
jgi:hypothetical protein